MSTPARPPAPTVIRPAGSSASQAPANQQVMNNLLNLIAMDRDGKLRPGQITQLRTLLANQTRYIVLKHLFERKQNPLVILTPNLDITLPYNGAPAILTKEQFNALVGGAIHEAQRIKSLLIPNPEIKEILAMSQEERNAKMAADPQLRQRFQTSVTFYTKGAEGFITPARPAGAQSASGTSTPRPPAAVGTAAASAATPPQTQASNVVNTTTASIGANPTSGSAVRPPASAPPTQSGDIAKTEPQETNQIQASSAQAESEAQTKSAPSAPSAVVPAPPVPVKTEPDIPAPPPPPVVPPKPVEPESVRRKRKLQEVLGEMAPGMEFEVGVTDIWSDVLDGFILESARGAASLAKHRKSEKVGLKDMAFFLDKTYGISVPGFAATVPERIHAGPEKADNKLEAGLDALAQNKEGKDVKEGKRRPVAPRAARFLKDRDEE